MHTDEARIKLKLTASNQLVAGCWLLVSIVSLRRRCGKDLLQTLFSLLLLLLLLLLPLPALLLRLLLLLPRLLVEAAAVAKATTTMVTA